MKYCFDLDGTLCEERPTFERSLAKPNIDIINMLYDIKNNKNFIIIYTARSWSEYQMTVNWLQENAVPYDLLIMGKPIYDVWIDDRAVKPEDFKKL